ncbi:MAG: ABC transporter substrate-binding protein, partial [Planctomycetota bacterium]
PEKYIHIDGKTFLEEYNWRMMPGSGPYMLKPEDLKKGQSMTITRRKDWWAEDKPLSKNTFNFAKIKFVPIRDRELEYEKFKAGDLDFFQVSRAQRWAEEIPKEKVVKQGWVQRRRIYNNSPEGFNGFVFNMRKKPFDDRRVRLAFCHLFNRELLMEKLFFNQYTLMDSYFPGRDWGNGAGNPQIRFDPARAEELLWEAGYRERNEEGILIGPDKKPLELTLEYESPAWTRIWLVVLEAYEEAGIKINLKLIDRSTRVKKIGDRQFRLHYQWWTGLLFPNPETSWRSDLADQKQNNNLPGFKNARVDELLTVYDRTFDRTEQKKITREIDSIIFNQHPYALGWYANFKRILYWDRFGHPPSYFTRIGDSAAKEIILTWWFDPEKEKRLDLAMEAGEALPQGAEDVRPWARPQK